MELETVTSESRPYDYKPVYERVCLHAGRDKMSDKDVGKTLGVSERQIRRARMEGMDWVMADRFCIAAGTMPHEVYGWDEWLTPEAFFAGDLKEKKVKPEDVAELYAAGAWRD